MTTDPTTLADARALFAVAEPEPEPETETETEFGPAVETRLVEPSGIFPHAPKTLPGMPEGGMLLLTGGELTDGDVAAVREAVEAAREAGDSGTLILSLPEGVTAQWVPMPERVKVAPGWTGNPDAVHTALLDGTAVLDLTEAGRPGEVLVAVEGDRDRDIYRRADQFAIKGWVAPVSEAVAAGVLVVSPAGMGGVYDGAFSPRLPDADWAPPAWCHRAFEGGQVFYEVRESKPAPEATAFTGPVSKGPPSHPHCRTSLVPGLPYGGSEPRATTVGATKRSYGASVWIKDAECSATMPVGAALERLTSDMANELIERVESGELLAFGRIEGTTLEPGLGIIPLSARVSVVEAKGHAPLKHEGEQDLLATWLKDPKRAAGEYSFWDAKVPILDRSGAPLPMVGRVTIPPDYIVVFGTEPTATDKGRVKDAYAQAAATGRPVTVPLTKPYVIELRPSGARISAPEAAPAEDDADPLPESEPELGAGPALPEYDLVGIALASGKAAGYTGDQQAAWARTLREAYSAGERWVIERAQGYIEADKPSRRASLHPDMTMNQWEISRPKSAARKFSSAEVGTPIPHKWRRDRR